MRVDANENREELPKLKKFGGLGVLLAILFLVICGGCDISPVPTPIPGDEEYEEGGFGVSTMPEEEEGEFAGSIGSGYEAPKVSEDDNMEVDRAPGAEDGDPPNSGAAGENAEPGSESADLEEGGGSLDEEEGSEEEWVGSEGDGGDESSGGGESSESGGESSESGGESEEDAAGGESDIEEDAAGGESDTDEPNDVCGPEEDDEDTDSIFDEPDAGSIENGADAGGC